MRGMDAHNDGVVVRRWGARSAKDCFHLTCSFRRSSPSGVQPPSVLSSLLLEEAGVNEGETLVKKSCLLIRGLITCLVYRAEADLNPGLSRQSQSLHDVCACRLCVCLHVWLPFCWNAWEPMLSFCFIWMWLWWLMPFLYIEKYIN